MYLTRYTIKTALKNKYDNKMFFTFILFAWSKHYKTDRYLVCQNAQKVMDRNKVYKMYINRTDIIIQLCNRDISTQ